MRKLILVFSLIFLVSFGNDIFAQSVLKGRVLSSQKSIPLAGANIIISNTYGCVTDDAGNFEIKLLAGEYILVVSYLGYKNYQKSIVVDDGINTIEVILNNKNYTVKTVKISAQGFQSDLRSSARVQKITSKEISSIPAQKVEGILQYATGVNVENTLGMFSDNTVVSMRGMGGNNQGRVLVMIDGVPVNKSDGGSVNWNAINVANVQDIKIIQGAASTLYGANAMGGVIDVRTSVPTEKLTASANVLYGTYNTLLTDAYFGQSYVDSVQKGTFWSAALHGGMSDGYITESEEYLEYGEDTLLRPSFFKELSGDINIGHSFSASEKLVFSLKGYTDKRGKGWQVFDEDGSYTIHSDVNIRLRYNGRIGKSLYWEAMVFGQFEEYIKQNEYINGDGDFSMYEINSHRSDAGVVNTLRYQIGNNLFKGGFDFRYGSVIASDNYFTSTDSIVNKGKIALGAIFLQDELTFYNNRLIITAGVRYDYAGFFNGDYSVYYPSKKINYLLHFQDTVMPTSTWYAVSPRLSFLYTNKRNIRLYASYSAGFRPPPLDDMCRSQSMGNRFIIANPQLKNEYINNIEIGGDILFMEKMKLSVSMYYSMGNNFMYEVSNGDSVDIGYKVIPVYMMDNISQMQAYGFEASTKIKLWEGITFFANYAYTNSTITDFEIVDPEVDYDLSGKFLANVPMHSASSGVTWENKYVNANLLWSFKGERFINDRNTIDVSYFLSSTYPAYQTLNLRLWRSFPKGFGIALNCDNLTNSKFLDSRGRKCLGRMFMVEVSWGL